MEKNFVYFNELAVRAITDEDAFTELYQHFFPRVYKHIFAKVLDENIADDIIGKVFMKIYDHLKDYNPEKAAFSTWIFHITENELKMHWRSKKYHDDNVEEWDEEFNPAAPEFEEPEHRAMREETAEQIKAALQKLPERERKIIEMVYWLNYKPAKIAEILEMTPNHVSVTLSRAKNSLKKYLKDFSPE